LQLLSDERAHLRNLVSPGGPAHVFTHHLSSHRAMADQQHRVRADAGFLEQRPLIGDRPRRAPVLIYDDGRDTLRHEIWRRPADRISIAQSSSRSRPVVGVGVDIDESGDDVPARRIDHARRLCVGELTDGRDAPVQNRDVSRKPRIAGAVHDAPVADQHVETLSRLSECDRQEGDD
jgi:hypothetical protein